MKVVKTVG